MRARMPLPIDVLPKFLKNSLIICRGHESCHHRGQLSQKCSSVFIILKRPYRSLHARNASENIQIKFPYARDSGFNSRNLIEILFKTIIITIAFLPLK